MADRTSAEIFGNIFTKLAEMEQTDQVKNLVKYVWDETSKYDFSDYQMYADEALLKLGLAYTVSWKDEETIEYKR